MKDRKNKAPKRLPVWAVILLDLLGLALALNTYALFHHVLPRAIQPATTQTAPVPTLAPAAATPKPTPIPVAAEVPDAPEITPEPTPEPTPDPRSPWAIAFEEHFTEDVVRTENSYASPNVSVTVTRYEKDMGQKHNVYFVADIYVAEPSCFRTYLAQNTFGRGIVENIDRMHAASGAVLSLTGDFYCYQGASLVLRNGVLYRDGRWSGEQSHCVLYNDGRMVTYGANELDLEQCLAEGAWQIWSFGPVLIENGGVVPTRFSGGIAVNDPNPRSAIGYYEPGHYCFLVLDGRRPSYSYGATFAEMAEIFAELGVQTAYNLDGGGSAVMMLNDGLVNSPSGGGRALSDIILIGEPLLPEAGAEEAPAEGGTGE